MIVANVIVSPGQFAFIDGGYILDMLLFCMKLFTWFLASKKKVVVTFKVDSEKSQDNIKQDFMLSVSGMKGFPIKFIK
jgi:hypothetical protein